MEPELVARRQGLQRHVRDLAVGNADDGPIERPDPGRPQADVVDGADDVAHLQGVADAHGLIDDQRHAGDDVLQRLLGGQRDRDAADAEAGQGRRRVDGEEPQRGEEREEDDDDVGEPAHEAHQRDAGARVQPGEASTHVAFDFAVQLDQQPRQARDEDEVGGGGPGLPHEQRQRHVGQEPPQGQRHDHQPDRRGQDLADVVGLREGALPRSADERRQQLVQQDRGEVEQRHAHAGRPATRSGATVAAACC